MPVSVIMPALNAERFIEDAIASLLAERGAVALESSRSTTARPTGRGDPRGTRPGGLRTPPAAESAQGNSRRPNTGLDHLPADCEFVTFLDADDISYPGRIARQRTLLADDPTIDALYGVMQMFTQQDPSALAPAPGSRTKLIRGPYLQSSMYRRRVFDQVGRFDESFRQGCDSDFVLRVIEQQFRLILDDGIAAYYRRHNANVTLNVEEVQCEFMLASLKWAARNRIANRGPIPRIFADMFLSRADIEKDFLP